MRIFKLAKEVIVNGEKIEVCQDLNELFAAGELLKNKFPLPLGSAVLLNYTNHRTRLGITSKNNTIHVFSIGGDELGKVQLLNGPETLLDIVNGVTEVSSVLTDSADVEIVMEKSHIIGYTFDSPLPLSLESDNKVLEDGDECQSIYDNNNNDHEFNVTNRIKVEDPLRINSTVSLDISLDKLLDTGKAVLSNHEVKPYTAVIVNFKEDTGSLHANKSYIAVFYSNNRNVLNVYSSNMGELLHSIHSKDTLNKDFTKHAEDRTKFLENLMDYFDIVEGFTECKTGKGQGGVLKPTSETIKPPLKPFKMVDILELPHGTKLSIPLYVSPKNLLSNGIILNESNMGVSGALFLVNSKDVLIPNKITIKRNITTDETYIASYHIYYKTTSFIVYNFNGEVMFTKYINKNETNYFSNNVNFFNKMTTMFPIVTKVEDIRGYSKSSFPDFDK